MIGMFFCFGGDTECLIESVSQFRETFFGGTVALCDDGEKSLTNDAIKSIDPDHYEKRKWNTKGNLNGWECVRGILKFQLAMHAKYTSGAGALKIDCDTIIMGKEWINNDAPICGVNIGTQVFFTGGARYLKADACERILQKSETIYTRPDVLTPEDQAIGNLAMSIYGSECVSIDWHEIAMSYSYIDPQKNNRLAQIVSFGNRHEISHGTPCDKRALAAMQMAKYRQARR